MNPYTNSYNVPHFRCGVFIQNVKTPSFVYIFFCFVYKAAETSVNHISLRGNRVVIIYKLKKIVCKISYRWEKYLKNIYKGLNPRTVKSNF